MVKNLPANARDTGSIPGRERFHMPQSNSARGTQIWTQCSRAQEPQLLSPHAATPEACVPQSLGSARREATVMRSPSTTEKGSPPCHQREACTATKTQQSQQTNKNYIYIYIYIFFKRSLQTRGVERDNKGWNYDEV